MYQDENKTINNKYQYSEFEIQFQKEQSKNLYLEQISILYEKVIEKFQKNDSIVCNPNIFSKLTKQKFTDWIIHNNCDLEKYFK